MSDSTSDRPVNEGQKRSAAARKAARERGAEAWGPGGDGVPDDEATDGADDGGTVEPA